MILSRLQLQHFRNYSHLDESFSAEMNYFLGGNGEGKTNLIESIYCLGLVKSFRTNNDRELVQIGHNNFQIKGEFVNELSVKHTIIVHYEDRRKAISLDGKKVLRHSTLIGLLPIVLFNPEDHRVTGGSPTERRRFLDILLSQSDKKYLAALQEYNKVLKQRNKLLSNLAEGQAGIQELDTWDFTLAKIGTQVVQFRLKFLQEVAEPLSGYYSQISNNNGHLKAVYLPQKNQSIEGETSFRNCLLSIRKQEIYRQQTLIGPHRDDVQLLIDDKDVRKHASRGEQKSVLLALKFVEFFYLKEKIKTSPILLLDDIYSELDEERQKNVVSRLLHVGQAFLTTTLLQKSPAAAHYSFLVKNGNLERL